MHVITNEKRLMAVSGGLVNDVGSDDSSGGVTGGGGGTPAVNSICYTPTDATCNPATDSTNMSHASAGTDSDYYGAATVTQVTANASDCKTDAAQGTALGAVVGTAMGKNPAAAVTGALAGLYLALTYSSGCQPKVVAK